MYNKIKEFREYIQNADDEHVEKVIRFLNISGFIEGGDNWIYQCDDAALAEDAIKFAESDFGGPMSYLVENFGVKHNDEW